MSNEAATNAVEVLSVEDVTVSFSGFKALKSLNFAMDQGELRVVIGPNGAGKTTLLDVITGKTKPSSGRIVFKGENITGSAEQDIARRGIGRKFQTPNVFKSLTVMENLSLAVKSHRGVLPSMFRPFSLVSLERVHEILELIGLANKANYPAAILAHGEKQWLELGMVMAQEPELLLIDEPVAGMTPRESERTGELLLAMARKHALLVIEHDMTFVRQIASKVTVLDDGMLLCEGTVEEVQNDPRVIEVYLGHDDEEAPASHAVTPT
jgi:urea transport system ATP-binding protein